MPRHPKKQPTKRLTLDFVQSVREQLERLRDQTNADSMSEVIRRAIAVYDVLVTTVAEGNKILIKTKQGDKELLLI